MDTPTNQELLFSPLFLCSQVMSGVLDSAKGAMDASGTRLRTLVRDLREVDLDDLASASEAMLDRASVAASSLLSMDLNAELQSAGDAASRMLQDTRSAVGELSTRAFEAGHQARANQQFCLNMKNFEWCCTFTGTRRLQRADEGDVA